MSVYGLLLLALVASSCSLRERPGAESETPPAAVSATPTATGSPIQVDSVALERSPCFGSCPVYRLVLFPDDNVHFESAREGIHSESAGEGGHTARGAMQAGAFSRIVTSMRALGFTALPDSVSPASMSGPCHTDAPTVTVLLYTGNRARGVADYHGCPSAQPGLRELQEEMDRAAGTDRWLSRPE